MKRTWLTTVLIFLLTANLALLLTLLLRSNSNTNNIVNPKNYDGKISHFDTKKQNKFEMHIAEQLGMDDNQKEQLNNFSSDFHSQKKQLFDKMFEIKGKYFDNLATENPDNAMLEQLADSLGKIHSAMIKLDHAHYKNIKSICTPEQAAQLDSLGRLHMNNKRGDDWSGKQRRQGKPDRECQNKN